MPLPRTLPPIAWVTTRATVPQGFIVGIYCHDKYIKYGTCLQRDLIRSWSQDLNPGLPVTKQPLYHLSHQPLRHYGIIHRCIYRVFHTNWGWVSSLKKIFSLYLRYLWISHLLVCFQGSGLPTFYRPQLA